MKVAVAVLLALACLAPALAAEKKPLEAKVGQEFAIELNSNPSTGYQWLLSKPLDPKVLKLISIKYKRPSSKAVGESGTEVLTFAPIAGGQAEIHLKYARLWEEGVPSSRATNFVVRVSTGSTRKPD